MSTQHTPGPWTFDKDTEEITCEKRQGMAAIATVETGFAEPFESEQQANARLIAAAPDLLEAIKNLVSVFSLDSEESEVVAARAAIAKAS